MHESPERDQRIESFIALFEGDITAAQAALSHYDNKRRSVAAKPSVQLRPDSESIVTIRDVSKKYILGKQPVEALRDVSLDVYKGEFVAITGASGSGKSTLLQLIGCLDKPTNGQIIVDGKDIKKLGDNTLSDLRKSTIGFIFQSFYLQPFLRLHDNLAVPAMFTSSKRQAIDNKVSLLLQQVGLSDRANHFPKELSGGQIQRAAIARALVNNPRIILADEPTGNLDSTNGQSIIDLFQTIRTKLGTTIVIVTHDTGIASQADRVIELKDGAVV
ncbi:ABC transporter ATP-binding protein [Candidatus Saccharibacteria bacterium]|nr:ABC transporter ATP-binding protein [Candidatus Saccharibacteria bacterium]